MWAEIDYIAQNFQMCPEELKLVFWGVLEEKDDLKDQIFANKQLKVLKGDQLQLQLIIKNNVAKNQARLNFL